MRKVNRLCTWAAAVLAALALSILPHFGSLAAATVKVTASDVNIRSDAGTEYSIVTTASLGETYEVGESREDSEGNTWYAITLTDGQTGYIRADFVELQQDTSDEASTEAGTEEASPYEIIEEKAADGTSTYYFVDNEKGIRMSFDEIQALAAQQEELEAELPNAGNSQKVLVIVLIILLVAAVIFDIAVFTRLLDAVRSARHTGSRAAGETAGRRTRTGRSTGRRERNASRSSRSRNRRETGETSAKTPQTDAMPAPEAEPAPIMDFAFSDAAKKESAKAAEKKEADSQAAVKEAAEAEKEAGKADGKQKKEEKPEQKKAEDAAAANGPSIPTFFSDEKKEDALRKEAQAAAAMGPGRPINWAAEDDDSDMKIAGKPGNRKAPEKTEQEESQETSKAEESDPAREKKKKTAEEPKTSE